MGCVSIGKGVFLYVAFKTFFGSLKIIETALNDLALNSFSYYLFSCSLKMFSICFLALPNDKGQKKL